jgi:hypothetical protein
MAGRSSTVPKTGFPGYPGFLQLSGRRSGPEDRQPQRTPRAWRLKPICGLSRSLHLPRGVSGPELRFGTSTRAWPADGSAHRRQPWSEAIRDASSPWTGWTEWEKWPLHGGGIGMPPCRGGVVIWPRGTPRHPLTPSAQGCSYANTTNRHLCYHEAGREPALGWGGEPRRRAPA